MNSPPAESCYLRQFLTHFYFRHQKVSALTDVDDLSKALGCDRRGVSRALDKLIAFGLVRPAAGGYSLTPTAIQDGDHGLYRIDFEATHRGLLLGILKILRQAQQVAPSGSARTSQFPVHGYPLRTLCLPLEDMIDYLENLKLRGAISLEYADERVSSVALTLEGISAVMDDSLDGHPRAGQVSNSGIQIGRIDGPVGAIGLGRDNFTQRVTMGGDHAELRQALDELHRAIEQATDLNDEQRNDGVDAIDQLREELAQDRPRPSRVRSALRTLGVVADAAGTAQGAAMVYEGVQKVTPLVQRLLEMIGS